MIETAPDTMCLSTDGLPDGWSPARVGDMVDLVNGFAFKPSHWKGRGLPIIRIQNLNSSDAPFNYCPDSMPDKYLVETNDLLFAWSGTPGTSFGAHVWKGPMGLLNQHIFRVDFNENLLDKHFVRLAINHNLDDYIEQAHGGVGLAHITKSKFETSLLSLPPLAEQKRIVRKVEECLAQVNSARKRLSRVPAILKRFRQAVLAAACSGRLTEDWREKQQNVETADQLVSRISNERLVTDKTSAIREVAANSLPTLPDKWTWVYLSDLGHMSRGKSRHRPRDAEHLYNGPYPFIQTGDIANSGGRITAHTQTYSEAGLQQSRLWPAGTVCLTIAANIAHSAILTYPACFPDSVVGIIPDANLCFKEYLEFFIRTARADLEQYAPATAQKNINIAILNDVAVPLPPHQEQREVVRRAEVLLNYTDAIQSHFSRATTRLNKLTQSILAKAFRGELVPTEAELARREGREYEPASVLLERIKKEREEQTSSKPKQQRRSGKAGLAAAKGRARAN